MIANTDSFYCIYEKYKYLMFSIAKNVLKESYYAEDAVQTSFIKLIEHIDKIDDLESDQIKRLIITITKNTAIDIYRKRSIQWEHEIRWEELINRPKVNFTTLYESSLLETFQKIPDIYKDVLLLKYASGFSNAEIADILEISEVNVRKRLSRGKRQLELLLKKEGAL